MSVTRTPLTARFMTRDGRPHPQLLPKPPGGKFKGGEHVVRRRLPLVVEQTRREHPAVHARPASNSRRFLVVSDAPLERSRSPWIDAKSTRMEHRGRGRDETP